MTVQRPEQQTPPFKIYKDFFVYTPGVYNNIGLGLSVTNTIFIQADSDFEWQKATFLAVNVNAQTTANTRVIPNMTVLITDTGSGRQLMNSGVPISTLFGEADNPFILPEPKLFTAKSTIQIQVTNFDATAATVQLYLCLIGRKILVTRG